MKTILVVDNELNDLNRAGEVLNRYGYEVITALDCSSALSALKNGAPVDLVLTEYRMPDMDGLEFVSSIRKLVPRVPVIMLTAYSDLESYIKTLSLGVFEYLNKPITPHNLRKVVKTALDGPRPGGASADFLERAS